MRICSLLTIRLLHDVGEVLICLNLYFGSFRNAINFFINFFSTQLFDLLICFFKLPFKLNNLGLFFFDLLIQIRNSCNLNFQIFNLLFQINNGLLCGFKLPASNRMSDHLIAQVFLCLFCLFFRICNFIIFLLYRNI